MIADGQAILGRQIHNAEIPRGSTCLLIQTRMHTFFPKHMHTVCGASGGCCCEVQSGAPLGLKVFVLLSWALLPSDDGPIVRASSGPALFRPSDKACFHKTKAREEGGKEGERGEKGSDGSVERQRRWKGEIQREAKRVKGRKEGVVIDERVQEGWARLVKF